MSVAKVAADFYSSPEYFTGFGRSNLRTWVTDLYEKILLRGPDTTGLDYWVATAAAYGRTAVTYPFHQSNESCHTRVEELYRTLLHRIPDQAGSGFWAGVVHVRGDLVLAADLARSAEYYDDAYDRHGRPATAPGAPMRVSATVGNGNRLSRGQNGLVWTSATATTTVLATPTGYTVVSPTGVSPGGIIYGVGYFANGTHHPLLWTSPTATPTVLTPPTGYTEISPRGVSAGGVIVGSVTEESSGRTRGFLHSP